MRKRLKVISKYLNILTSPTMAKHEVLSPGVSDKDINIDALEVVYKSDNFLCVNKNFDVKINSNNPNDVTVEHQVRKLFPHLVDPKCTHGFRFVHRLDYATSGILCLALNKRAAGHLSAMFKAQQVTKYYLALVRGYVHNESTLIDIAIGPLVDQEWPGRMCAVDHPHCSDPRPTKTLFMCLERGTYDGQPATKVLLKPFTGRQHQLRVHCDYIGHTIVGDYTYSNRCDTTPERMMLHSYKLQAQTTIENLDLQTSDPFVPDLVKPWQPVEVVRPSDEALKLAQNFDFSNDQSVGGGLDIKHVTLNPDKTCCHSNINVCT
ncbi:RNA pseudouridylate synthase domain-containing protein 1-like [Dreissena polymorpha]|nr:RNA pseudouridylate synthase domain-containing protein 1-like [Dreissena polymorpha]